MAKRAYRKKRVFRKKRYARRRTTFNRRMKYPMRAPTVWRNTVAPKILKIKMKYHTQVILDATGEEFYVMRGNSVFDPDYTSAGNQPVNYDDIAPLYDEYCVLGSKCVAAFRNLSAYTANVMIKASTVVTPPSITTEDPYLQPLCKVRSLGTASGSHDGLTLKMYQSTQNLFGRPPQYSTDFGAATTASPTLQWYWIVGAYDNTPASVPLNAEVDITVTYYVVFRKVVSNLSKD